MITTMSTLSSIAQSGMHAAQMRLDSAAHNIANLGTQSFQPQGVSLTEAAGQGGVQAQVTHASNEGASLERNMVESLSASYAFKANAVVIKNGNATIGSLLDTFA